MSTPEYFVPDRLNDDFTQPALARHAEEQWVPSAQSGVERRFLDRVGAEVARATSLVRYRPDSYFPAHTHGLGEEYLVLEGVFSDEHGHYGPDCYVRNPPGSSHTPFTREGCVIFVKLRQMEPEGEPQVVMRPDDYAWQEIPGGRSAILFQSALNEERVTAESLQAGFRRTMLATGGAEILVLDGELTVDSEVLAAGDWLRLPARSETVVASARGCRLWMKHGHLADPAGIKARAVG